MNAQAVAAQNMDFRSGLELQNQVALSPVFQGLGRDILQVFFDGGVLHRLEPLEQAVGEGEMDASLYIVVSGRLIGLLANDRLARFANNAMVSLDCYIPGDSFGEDAVLEQIPLPATASIVATEPSQLMSISRDNFMRAIAADSGIGQVVYRNLFGIQTRRLRALTG